MNANARKYRRPDLRAAMCGVAFVASALIALPAFAQTSDSLDIANTAAGAEGRVGVNAAAGVFNQQVNSGVIASGDELAIGINTVNQNLGYNEWGTPAEGGDPCLEPGACQQSAVITGNSFSDSNGAIAVNGAAGAENQQANLFTIGIGIEGRVMTLDALSQTRASKEPAGDLNVPAEQKTADIGPQAFTDASGLVQVNLTAGERNSSANLFALTIAGSSD
jgi:hypothetical protein